VATGSRAYPGHAARTTRRGGPFCVAGPGHSCYPARTHAHQRRYRLRIDPLFAVPPERLVLRKWCTCSRAHANGGRTSLMCRPSCDRVKGGKCTRVSEGSRICSAVPNWRERLDHPNSAPRRDCRAPAISRALRPSSPGLGRVPGGVLRSSRLSALRAPGLESRRNGAFLFCARRGRPRRRRARAWSAR
jgi:hypothetical protein